MLLVHGVSAKHINYTFHKFSILNAMIKCKLCEKEYKNNLAGGLTSHLQDKHNISNEDVYAKMLFSKLMSVIDEYWSKL